MHYLYLIYQDFRLPKIKKHLFEATAFVNRGAAISLPVLVSSLIFAMKKDSDCTLRRPFLKQFLHFFLSELLNCFHLKVKLIEVAIHVQVMPKKYRFAVLTKAHNFF